MMSPVFKFHLLVPAAERREARGETRENRPVPGVGRVWSGGQWASGPAERERERVVRHSLGQQTELSPGALSRPSTHTKTRDLNGLCRALLISRDSLIMAL